MTILVWIWKPTNKKCIDIFVWSEFLALGGAAIHLKKYKIDGWLYVKQGNFVMLSTTMYCRYRVPSTKKLHSCLMFYKYFNNFSCSEQGNWASQKNFEIPILGTSFCNHWLFNKYIFDTLDFQNSLTQNESRRNRGFLAMFRRSLDTKEFPPILLARVWDRNPQSILFSDLLFDWNIGIP